MTKEQACNLLTAEQIAEATAVGKAWGEIEVECWKDEHDGSFARSPEWVMGNWCGHNPIGSPADSEAADAYDLIVDLSARDVWEAARE